MCGIVGYVGKRDAYPLLFDGLVQLEYRGYDSAGICVGNQGELHLYKTKGRVAHLQQAALPGVYGIAHTRWATHGRPDDHNAHPFFDESRTFCVVHNGIIENYLELKEGLQGVQFLSETDSEVIVHLIAKVYAGNLLEAVRTVVGLLQGAFALCVIHAKSGEVVGARNGSPLVVGVGEDEYFFGSDVSAFAAHTKQVVYVQDFELVRISLEGVEISTFAGEVQPAVIKTIDWDVTQAQKGGYKHFMLKEIYEQPEVLMRSLATVPLPDKAVTLVACGTAYYACMLGKYWLEQARGRAVVVETAAEFRYKAPTVGKDDVVVVVSQSGETADTLAAVRLAKNRGAATYGIINVVASTIAREVDTVCYTQAGPEIGVASTKAFLAQLRVLYSLAFGQIIDLKESILAVLVLEPAILAVARDYYTHTHMFFMGRNTNYPLALEGALKLKEISYMHAQGYPAGELKHGPIALISEDLPTVVVCPQDRVYQKTLSNIEEIKARGGKVIGIGTAGDTRMRKVCDAFIGVPLVANEVYPFGLAVVLQLFAYHIADLRECDIDKPRNLAKSVTVE